MFQSTICGGSFKTQISPCSRNTALQKINDHTMSNQRIAATAKSKFAFFLITAIFLVSMDILLNDPEASSSSSSLLDTTQKIRHLLSEDDVETPKLQRQHFGNGGEIDKEILASQKIETRKHLNEGKNASFVIKYNNRWRHRFTQATRRNKLGGMFFFRHIRKVS